MKKIMFLFSGLGTQYCGMGSALYRQDAVFKASMDELDQAAEKLFGSSVLDVCYSTKNNKVFNHLFLSQTMLFMVQYSLARTLIANGVSPDCILGYSLGEFVALAAADAVSPIELLEFFAAESELIEKECEEGSMLVIAASSNIYTTCADLFQDIDLISVNSERHFIVSGKLDCLAWLSNSLNQMKILNYQLPVGYAFHTKWIESVKDKMIELMKGLRFQQPSCMLLSSLENCETVILKPEYLWNVIRQKIYYKEKLQNTFGRNYLYIDCSPSGDSMAIIKHSRKEEICFPSLISRFTFGRNSEIDVMQMVKTIQKSVFKYERLTWKG